MPVMFRLLFFTPLNNIWISKTFQTEWQQTLLLHSPHYLFCHEFSLASIGYISTHFMTMPHIFAVLSVDLDLPMLGESQVMYRTSETTSESEGFLRLPDI
jgi:hypothetical protein